MLKDSPPDCQSRWSYLRATDPLDAQVTTACADTLALTSSVTSRSVLNEPRDRSILLCDAVRSHQASQPSRLPRSQAVGRHHFVPGCRECAGPVPPRSNVPLREPIGQRHLASDAWSATPWRVVSSTTKRPARQIEAAELSVTIRRARHFASDRLRPSQARQERLAWRVHPVPSGGHLPCQLLAACRFPAPSFSYPSSHSRVSNSWPA